MAAPAKGIKSLASTLRQAISWLAVFILFFLSYILLIDREYRANFIDERIKFAFRQHAEEVPASVIFPYEWSQIALAYEGDYPAMVAAKCNNSSKSDIISLTKIYRVPNGRRAIILLNGNSIVGFYLISGDSFYLQMQGNNNCIARSVATFKVLPSNNLLIPELSLTEE